ncbi:hypothetical protein AB0B03_25635 [Micromonospora chalcea]
MLGPRKAKRIATFGKAACTSGPAPGRRYGLCYGNGRALGALLTGTQLVRAKDGGRIGLKACWAMLVRTLLMPVLVVVLVVTAFSTGSSDAPGSLVRTTIDPDATRRLHDAGIR